MTSPVISGLHLLKLEKNFSGAAVCSTQPIGVLLVVTIVNVFSSELCSESPNRTTSVLPPASLSQSVHVTQVSRFLMSLRVVLCQQFQ